MASSQINSYDDLDEESKVILGSAMFVEMPKILKQPVTETEGRLKFLIENHEAHANTVRQNIRRQYQLQLRSHRKPQSSVKNAVNDRSSKNASNEKPSSSGPAPILSKTSDSPPRSAKIISDLSQRFDSGLDDPCVDVIDKHGLSDNQHQKASGSSTVQDDERLVRLIQYYDKRAAQTREAWEKWLRKRQIANGTLPKDTSTPPAPQPNEQSGDVSNTPTGPQLGPLTSRSKPTEAPRAPVSGEVSNACTRPTSTGIGANKLPSGQSAAEVAGLPSRKSSGSSTDAISALARPGKPQVSTQTRDTGARTSTTGSTAQISGPKGAKPVWAQPHRVSLKLDTSMDRHKSSSNDTSMPDAPSPSTSKVPLSAPPTPGGAKDPSKSRRPSWAAERPQIQTNRIPTQAHSMQPSYPTTSPASLMSPAEQAPVAQMTTPSAEPGKRTTASPQGSSSAFVDRTRDPRKRKLPSGSSDVYARRW